MFPPEMANGGPPPMMPPDVGPDLDELVDELGNGVKVNAQQSAGTQNPQEAKDFADAALKLTQAIVALIPYADPTASGDKQTDNPAKTGD